MSITQEDIITTLYLFLIVGGIITLFGGWVAYLNKKSKRRA